jgi:hypothetical protein
LHMFASVMGGQAFRGRRPLSLTPNLLRRLVLPEANVNRVPQEVVGRPGQIGDLDDKLGLDPVYSDRALSCLDGAR